MPSIEQAAAAFLEHVRARLPKDSGTPTAKAVVLRRSLWSLDPGRPIESLTRGDLDAMVDYLIAHGRRTKGSIAQARTTLRQFTEFCHRREWLDSSVTVKAEIIKSRRQDLDGTQWQPQRIPREHWSAYLEEAGALHFRARMAMALGLYCARRVSEVVRVRFGDVDWEGGRITFNNKKLGRLFALPLFDEMRHELDIYLAEAKRLGHGDPDPGWYLVPARLRAQEITGINSRARFRVRPADFPVDMFRMSSQETVQKDVRRLLTARGFGPKEGTHTLRRSAATWWAKSKGLRAAQAILDHDTVVTTQRYTGNEDGYAILLESITEDTGNVVRPSFGRRSA